ncbi:unnamed protein product [Adineta steineri]|uniref:Uncharacterized protein n=1 Tax=Adineta steineri TaxID=433720 RepID=A0A814DJL9_9BILA|nr:unnamed protein product [Adineta steineri]CAF3868640.1 unnamed protein product [Adineta steineri]
MEQPNYVAYPDHLSQSYRFVTPANYKNGSPPFVNQSFDRFNIAQHTIRPNQYVSHLIRPTQNPQRLPKPVQARFNQLPPRLQYQSNYLQQIRPQNSISKGPVYNPKINKDQKANTNTQNIIISDDDDDYDVDDDLLLNLIPSKTTKQSSVHNSKVKSDNEYCHTCGTHIPTHLHNLQKYLDNH